jgi:protein O-GlcNAc transferase
MAHLILKQKVDAIVSHFNRHAYADVVVSAKRFVSEYPTNSFGWRALGAAQKKLGQLNDAIVSMHRALQIDPSDFEAHQNIAMTYRDVRRFDMAERHFRFAVSLRPNVPLIHRELGDTLLEQGRLFEAEASHRRALAIDPKQAKAHANLAVALQQQGKIEEALAACAKAVALEPNLWVAWSNLLMSSHYLPNLDSEHYLALAQTFGRQQTATVGSRCHTRWHCVDNEESLRVGFVSADLYAHPVGFFFQGVLEAIHKNHAAHVERYVYCATPYEDDTTRQLKSHASRWRDVFHLDAPSIAKQIVEDKVHILIDLSGHTAGNQLAVFAHKPAPVCVSWLGYFASTGMTEMDYVVTDPGCVPPQMGGHFCEQLLQMPKTRLCFTPPTAQIAITELPALRNGCITFGSFQNIAKINDRVLAVWSRVLSIVPRSKFRIQCTALADRAVRAVFENRLKLAGIDLARVALTGSVSRAQYLSAHNEIDLLLDTFPYAGGTTTCEALWMGVPTVTLRGQSMIARQGASMLECVGLNEWIAENEDEYVSKAASFCSDLTQLAATRLHLRSTVIASPLFDCDSFANDFANLLRRAWRETGAERVKAL